MITLCGSPCIEIDAYLHTPINFTIRKRGCVDLKADVDTIIMKYILHSQKPQYVCNNLTEFVATN